MKDMSTQEAGASGAPESRSEVILQTEGISKHFGGLKAVHEVNFEVRRGELMSIIGPNGAGKTTFFNLLSGHLEPTSGRIFFAGRDVSRAPSHRRARLGLGRSFQITNVFPDLTSFENIRVAVQAKKTTFQCWRRALGDAEINRRAEELLERVGLADKRHIEAGTLAYGDQRYLEIGIALASNPTLLLLDEPTAGMSPEESARTAEFIKELARTVDIILVEHDMEVVMNISDNVTCMHEGEVIACQPPAEIRQNPEVQSCYLRD
jgi:branched-chain amino acid transport system ATP-binding protein